MSEPICCNYSEVEVALLKINSPNNNLCIIGVYHSKSKVTISRFHDLLEHLFERSLDSGNVPVNVLGDFNFNLLENAYKRAAVYKYLTQEKQCIQLINQVTTDHNTQIDHIYTNLQHRIHVAGVVF